ncbi:Hsp20/alpha crystallin family protein [Patescibacteria group bacterium]|nr:Hsp20/alpha crystallin family protein [Patescibacteria group bacterium]
MIKEIFVSGGHKEPINNAPSTGEELDVQEEEFELPIDIARRGGYLIIKAPVVGATTADISLTITNNVVTIRKHDSVDTDKFDNYYLKECHWGAVEREFRLPLKVDSTGAEANLQEGILRVTLPIIEQPKGRSIKIS